MPLKILIVYLSTFFLYSKGLPSSHKESVESWTGKWFPAKPAISNYENIGKSRISMGILNSDCDDAEKNLKVDWFDDDFAYNCYNSRSLYFPKYETKPIYEIQEIPVMYKAAHFCMNETITYDDIIPTFGTHRPLWPKWGEYLFVPVQRWLHNLEHGGIVMLYHSCANKLEVKHLREIVKGCLYRHIITPYNLLSSKRPLALVAWGKKLEMSVVSPKIVKEFIREAALRGAEHTSRDGQYSHKLLSHAKVVTDENDSTLCPEKQRD